jgi:hypothetical protein
MAEILLKDELKESKTPKADELREQGVKLDIPKEAPSVVKMHKADASDEVFVTSQGKKIFDPGEQLVSRANRTKQTTFDRDMFFTSLYENWLIAVERNEPRYRPSGIITHWDMHTTFGDFLTDSIAKLEHTLWEIKKAKEAHVQKFRAIDDSVLAEAKIDKGSSAVGQTFKQEDYEVIEEIARRSIEHIKNYNSGKISFIVNDKTGRVRVVDGEVKD